MNMEAARETYFIEARELLEQMESLLLQFESHQNPDGPESLNALFRAAHTIKGSAGIFGFHAITRFTHVVENALDLLRDGQLKLEPELIALLFRCSDHIAVLLDVMEQQKDDPDAPLPADIQQQGTALIDALEHLLGKTASPSATPAKNQNAPTDISNPLTRFAQHLAEQPGGSFSDQAPLERLHTEVENDYWHISVRFGENSFREGMEPLSFLSFLNTLGQTIHIVTLHEDLPTLDAFDPETCYLGFEIQFLSNASKQEIEEVFDFMRDGGFLRILPPHSALENYVELIAAMPEIELRLGEILLECGALTESELQAALKKQKQDKQPLGEMLVSQDVRLSPVLQAALQKQQQVRENVSREQKTLRVDADKLDILINLVGELVTAGAGTVLLAEQLGNGPMIESVSRLNNLLEEVRDASLKLRMVPIGATFARFQRVVRDTARELGKEVELIIHGAETELDKSVVEKIADPLMHLVRNALDHGIEQPHERQEKGKPEKGTLTLNAYHDSGYIVIEVSDDGKGLNPEVLRRKAIEKGLIDEETPLSRHDTLNLIFEPGFSTAAQVSNISGRGVGMDVVKRNITELRGRIDIETEVNVGTRLRIMLPLTLAIIDGFLVGVADEAFVIPLELVQECVELSERHLHEDSSDPYINLRGEVLPLINLRRHFDLPGRPPKRQSVVVVRAGDNRGGLVVDRLMGEFQTVIKPLGKLFERISGLSGSTILGTGKVALILDVQGLVASLACLAIGNPESEKRI